MAYKKTDRLIAYNNQYNKDKYDRFSLMLPKGKKEVIQNEAKKNGEIIEEALKDICSKYSFLDYRGIGMIWGIDFSRVDTTFALKCVHEAFEKHLICEVAGRKDAVLKIMPPLTIEEETLREGLAIVKEVVDSVMA